MLPCQNEERLRKIELEGAIMSTQLTSLVKSLDKLSSRIFSLVLALIPTILSVVGFLIWQVIQK